MSLVNPHRGEAALEIGGRERVLRIDFAALARIEEGLGVSFLRDPDDASASHDLEGKLQSMRGLMVGVAAGLSDRRHVIDPERVGEWLSEPGVLAKAAAALGLALTRFFSGLAKPKGVEDEDRPTSEAGAQAPASTGQG